MKSPFLSPCKKLLRWALLHSYCTSAACLSAVNVEKIAIIGSPVICTAFAHTGSIALIRTASDVDALGSDVSSKGGSVSVPESAGKECCNQAWASYP